MPDTLKMPNAAAPELSILVMFTHDVEQAERCLRGIADVAQELPPAETILVLNAASDGVRNLITQQVEGARLIDSPVNTGTAIAWQLGFTAALGENVLLMHEDAVPLPGMVPSLIETMQSDERVAVVGPWLIENDGDELSNGGWLCFNDFTLFRIDPAEVPDDLAAGPYAVDMVSSAIALWKRSAWRDAGGFDENRFPAVGVDGELSIAMTARGRSVMVNPRARGIHRTGAMDSAKHALSGPRLRDYLFERFFSVCTRKWAGVSGQFFDYAAAGWQHPLPPEVAAAGLRHDAERRAAPSVVLDPMPQMDHPITNPDNVEPWPEDIDDAIIERLVLAERAVIDGYTLWLVEREAEHRAEIERRDGDYAELAQEHQEMIEQRDALELRSQALNDVYASRWWRLGGRLRKLAGR